MMNISRYTTFRFDYEELFSIFTDSHEAFPADRARAWMRNHEPFAVQACITYVLLIFSIKRFMKNRQPFDLQYPLNIWNGILALLALTSTMGMTREFFDTLFNKGIYDSLCTSAESFYDGDNGYYIFLNNSLRLAEFLDTIFIVLRKKPLMFIHWYHHMLTLYFAWSIYPYANPNGRYGLYINSGIHTIMYSYYFLRSVHIPVPTIIARSITSMQIVQFFVIFWSLFQTTYYAYVQKRACQVDLNVLLFSWFTDLCYLFLFIQFYLRRYKKSDTTEKKIVKDD